MKKIIIYLLIICFPFSVLVYSNEVILGGNTLGITVNLDGALVVGFYKINNKYNKTDLQVGDTIIKVGKDNIESVSDLTKLIEKNMINNSVDIIYKRDNKEYQTTLKLIKDGSSLKTGLYVKDNITGIGTLTYIDPATNIFGALGHEILESSSNTFANIKDGKIYKNKITSIDKSVSGTPGGKNAKYYPNVSYGNISKNTIHGIYGNYLSQINNNSIVPIGTPELGLAKIHTVINDETIDEFDINIVAINNTSLVKNIVFEVVDERLIDKTGGIVQGMSGSPITQNGYLVGAVTHVVSSEPKNGYGLFITTMLEEGEK